MKTVVTILFTFILTTAYGQIDDNQLLLDSAKTLFKNASNLNQEEFDTFDYSQIISLLEKVVEMNPNNAEAKYFLGYAYSRVNAKDGRSMIAMDLETVKKSSEQFEKVNKLTPKYSGEILVLDPYSKLTSEWGAMAMAYLHKDKVDSAIWAFKEGKKRGGFGNFVLELTRKILDGCSQNAILVSSGDNFTIPLWYLQTTQGYRKDISVVDISLLNTTWYPNYLSRKNIVAFDLSNKVLDTIDYVNLVGPTITIKNFTWTTSNHYLSRGDRVFLSLLRANNFQRDLYFTPGFVKASRLSLEDYLTASVVIDKLTFSKTSVQPYESYKESITHLLQLADYVNLNSDDEIELYDFFRYTLFNQVYVFLTNNDLTRAKELMNLLDKYGHENKVPYLKEQGREYADYLRGQLQ